MKVYRDRQSSHYLCRYCQIRQNIVWGAIVNGFSLPLDNREVHSLHFESQFGSVVCVTKVASENKTFAGQFTFQNRLFPFRRTEDNSVFLPASLMAFLFQTLRKSFQFRTSFSTSGWLRIFGFLILPHENEKIRLQRRLDRYGVSKNQSFLPSPRG